jgi:hypothetical protein
MIDSNKNKVRFDDCQYCSTPREHEAVCPLKDLGDSGETTGQIKMQLAGLKKKKKI